MGAAAIPAVLSLLSVGAQVKAGRTAVKESEQAAQIQETAATQREADRKERLASAMATANASAGARGIAAFEGSPLTILQTSIEAEETATERDRFNTRIGASVTRARGRTARTAANIGAARSLIQGTSQTAQLIPE